MSIMYAQISTSLELPITILSGEDSEKKTFLLNEQNIFNTKRFRNFSDGDVAQKFKDMQENIMAEQIPILTKLLAETPFDTGYESEAERYFNDLYKEYGIIADTVLQNIYLQNMYDKPNIVKHLLFVVANLSPDRRTNLVIIPLAGISNPDIELQDLSVRCFELWGDKQHVASLRNLYDSTTVPWFKEYVKDVIEELEED